MDRRDISCEGGEWIQLAVDKNQFWGFDNFNESLGF
jgi:hypothetical protein